MYVDAWYVIWNIVCAIINYNLLIKFSYAYISHVSCDGVQNTTKTWDKDNMKKIMRQPFNIAERGLLLKV